MKDTIVNLELILDEQLEHVLIGVDAEKVKAQMDWPKVRARLVERLNRNVETTAFKMIDHYLVNCAPEITENGGVNG